MQRPDAQMVRAACKFKEIDKKDIEYTLSLPFLYFADQEHLDLPWLVNTPELVKVIEEESLAIGPENWLFKEFVMMFKSRGVLTRHEFTYITPEDSHPLGELFKTDPKIESLLSVWTWDQRETDSGPYSYLHTIWRIYEDGKEIRCDGLGCSFNFDAKYSQFTRKDMTKEEEENYFAIATESIGVFIQTVQAMHVWLKESDRHPVEVMPVKQPKLSPLNKDKPWRRATGPRILFLDRMPTTEAESTGTHASPKPHQRRGHWRELSHPRYRHHPQYKQKIWVKPSFIGPEQAEYEGNLYRLIKPLDELLVA